MSRPVRLYARNARGAALARRRLEAVPGSLELVDLTGPRRLSTGPQGAVAEALLLTDEPDPGRVVLLGPDRQVVVDLAVRDWVPSLVGLGPQSRGGSDDELAWSGFGLLLDTAGVPVRRDRLETVPEDDGWPVVPPPAAARAVTPVLLLALVVYLVGLRVSDEVVELGGLGLALAGGVLALLVERTWRQRREAGALDGEVLAPAPGTAVTPRFARRARLVLAPADGPVETVAVIAQDDEQAWFDGPAGPTGLRTVRVVTAPGAPSPDRADLVDGLGREVVRLPYDEWFGGPGGPALLARLQARGLRVEQTTGAALPEVVRQVCAWPRSGPPGVWSFMSADAVAQQRNAAFGVAVGAGALVLSYGPPVLLGLLAAAVLVGPLATDLLSRRWLDRPRAPVTR